MNEPCGKCGRVKNEAVRCPTCEANGEYAEWDRLQAEWFYGVKRTVRVFADDFVDGQ